MPSGQRARSTEYRGLQPLLMAMTSPGLVPPEAPGTFTAGVTGTIPAEELGATRGLASVTLRKFHSWKVNASSGPRPRSGAEPTCNDSRNGFAYDSTIVRSPAPHHGTY